MIRTGEYPLVYPKIGIKTSRERLTDGISALEEKTDNAASTANTNTGNKDTEKTPQLVTGAPRSGTRLGGAAVEVYSTEISSALENTKNFS